MDEGKDSIMNYTCPSDSANSTFLKCTNRPKDEGDGLGGGGCFQVECTDFSFSYKKK